VSEVYNVGFPPSFRSRLVERLGRYCEDIEPAIYVRGWLIERARSRKLREALRQARVHVYRQFQGRHEQDRADAEAWLAQWGDL
jgi:hypothetical protein